jgi:hypothetical protein
MFDKPVINRTYPCGTPMTGFSLSKRRTDVPFRERLYCTIREAESYSGYGNTTINKWLTRKRVKSKLIDGMRRIDVPSFLAVIDGEDQQQTA